MKNIFWILTFLTIFGFGMYDQGREDQRRQINLPVAVVR